MWTPACAGRSAYFCLNAACIGSGLKKGKLERALKANVSEEDRERLKQELECKLR